MVPTRSHSNRFGRRGLALCVALVFGLPASAAVTPQAVVPSDVLRDFRPPPALKPAADKAAYTRLQLGRMLFFDPILSRSGAVSCESCHNPGLSWASGLPKAVGDGGSIMLLRAPTLLDVATIDRFGWDGKFPDIEAVTFGAITGHANMNLTETEALGRLRNIPGYVALFSAAFPGQGITPSTVSEAVAAFERTILSGPGPFDRFVAGEPDAISASAKRGFMLFNGRGRCSQCHSGWAFTDGSFHDIGSALGEDFGRGRLFPTSRRLRYAFKTPTLRDVARRAPYMHNGSKPDLVAVLDLYDKGGIDRPSRSELIRPLGLSAGEKADLLAFLETLTEDPVAVDLPVLPR